MLRLMRLIRLRVLLTACAVVVVSGCATMTGEATQAINIQTVDANGRPIEGMKCRIVNGSAEYLGDSPLFGLRVRRSSQPLVAECQRRGYALARALIIPRAELASGSTAQLLLPGGSSMLIIDHLTGFMYEYPRWIRPQAGADMIFDRADERGRDPTPGVITRQFDAQVRHASGVQDARVD